MRSALTVLVVFVLLVPSVYAGDYPRHVDPASLVTVEPDAEMLFLIYHNLFQGMLLENITFKAEWFDWAGAVFSVPDLNQLLDEYRDQLIVQAESLGDAEFFLDQALIYLGEFDLENAGNSFFMGVSALERSNHSLPILHGLTINLGERLQSNPAILLQDIGELELLIEDYQTLVQVLVSYVEGDTLTEEDIDRLKDILSGVFDEEYLENIDEILDPLQLELTNLELNVYPESVTVGENIVVSGRLFTSDGALARKRVSLSIGDMEISFITDSVGMFNEVITVPYIYENTTTVRCFYWPRGDDVQLYSPSSDSREIELIFFTPELEFQHSEAYPGLLWNVSGRLSVDGVGVGGLTVVSSIDGRSGAVISDGDGFFDVSVRVDPTSDGVVKASVVSLPNKVYAGAEELFPVEVSYYPLVFRVDASSWVLSGGSAALNFWVESNGVPLDRCVFRVRGEEREVSYSDGGYSLVNLYTEVGRMTGGSKYWGTVEPKEPWVESGSLSGEF